MEIIKQIPTDIIGVINDIEAGIYPQQHPYVAGSRSIVYKIVTIVLKYIRPKAEKMEKQSVKHCYLYKAVSLQLYSPIHPANLF